MNLPVADIHFVACRVAVICIAAVNLSINPCSASFYSHAVARCIARRSHTAANSPVIEFFLANCRVTDYNPVSAGSSCFACSGNNQCRNKRGFIACNTCAVFNNESVVIGRGTFLIIGIYAAKDGTGAADGHPVAAGISRIGFCAIDKCRSPASHNINFANACNSRIRPHHKHTNFAIIYTKHAACRICRNRNVTGCGITCNIADGNCDSRFRNRRGGKAVHPPCAQQGSQYDSGQPFPDFRFLFQHIKHPQICISLTCSFYTIL